MVKNTGLYGLLIVALWGVDWTQVSYVFPSGSAHFVYGDENCRVPENERKKFAAIPAYYSHLYLCIDGELAAVICIHDPLRAEARSAVAS